MTAQEIFSKVRAHLMAQGRKSMNSSGECRYRTDEGLMCAVGCLIGDDDYEADMEGQDVIGLDIDGTLPLSLQPHVGLLELLQRLHDYNEPKYWPREFAKLAKARRLVDA